MLMVGVVNDNHRSGCQAVVTTKGQPLSQAPLLSWVKPTTPSKRAPDVSAVEVDWQNEAMSLRPQDQEKVAEPGSGPGPGLLGGAEGCEAQCGVQQEPWTGLWEASFGMSPPLLCLRLSP